MDNMILLSKAFSDLNRLKITALIQREKELCVCEICDTLKLSQPLVSRHLKQLKESSVLQSYQRGKWIIYTITSKPTPILKAYLRELHEYEKTLGALCVCSRISHAHQ